MTPRQAASGCPPPPTARTGDLRRPPSNASVEPRSWCIRSLGVNLSTGQRSNCEKWPVYPLAAASVSLGSLSHRHMENGNLTTSRECQTVSSGQFTPFYLPTLPTKYLDLVQVKWFKESLLYIATLVELGIIILQVPSTWLQQKGGIARVKKSLYTWVRFAHGFRRNSTCLVR